MFNRTVFGITTAVATFSVLCAAMAVDSDDKIQAVDRDDKIQAVDRIPASLIRLSSGEARQLKSKDGLKILRVDDFDEKFLKVDAMTATELRITSLKSGCKEMKITYENGNVEQLVFIITPEADKKPLSKAENAGGIRDVISFYVGLHR